MSADGTALGAEIKRMIKADGPMRLDRYMDLCLGHPEYGYYRTRDPFGQGGDFTTAPEVSQMFGELIAVWCIDAWDALGQPGELQIVELGPGRGTLMADLLRTLRSVASFTARVDVHLVETSEILRKSQREAIAPFDANPTWHDALASVPGGVAVVVANEFFDALPVRQFERRSGAWFGTRLVGLELSDGDLTLGLLPFAAVQPEVTDFQVPQRPSKDGDLLGDSRRRGGIMARDLAARLSAHAGAALIMDYGHLASGFGDTMQAVKAHEPVEITSSPGASDLTSHVDFSDLAAAMAAAGATVWPALTQRAFLLAMGIEPRAEVLKRNAAAHEARDIDAACARLTDCDQMGNLFKVCAATAGTLRPPYAFGEMAK